MKTYQIELKRTSYVTLIVGGNTEEEAEAEAWRIIEGNTPNSSDASWDIESIEEMKGT